jgi:hypothetical protein
VVGSVLAELAQGKGFVEGADAVQDEQVGARAAIEVGVELGSGEGEGAAVLGPGSVGG